MEAEQNSKSPINLSLTNQSISEKHLTIGCLIFDNQDQIDFTGPFEVLSRIPDVTVHVISKTMSPVTDIKGLVLTPNMAIAQAPQLDLLHVSGGIGQQQLMDDKEILDLIRNQFNSGRYVFSVCTGALLCGASGILKGMKATTHWAAWDLLPYYGAIPIKQRVVIDRNLISAAGVTAGIDGALEVAMLLRGREVAEAIQLEIEYAPEPRFNSGSPDTASEDVIKRFFENYGHNKDLRQQEAKHFALELGVKIP
jgi:cyclohexyl-isocyanide hydratase